MKQFRCADIVPGCKAAVRAATIDEVVAIASSHLHDTHSLDSSPELVANVRQRVSNESLLQVLRHRF